MLRPTLTERVPDALTSIGNDPETLQAFKTHAGLPPEESWTEANSTLKGMLASAENAIEELTGVSYRARSFKLYLSDIPCRQGFRKLILPRYPVTSVNGFGWTSSSGSAGVFLENTDFTIAGKNSKTPTLTFKSTVNFPDTSSVAYPYIFEFNAGPTAQLDLVRLTIFELAAYYYRYPEAVSDKSFKISSLFQSNIDLLAGSFL
jgi:hypothetical protein